MTRRLQTDEAEKAVARCPPPPPVVVRLLEHGPLLVSGPIRIETEAGNVVLEADKATLCRCGGAGNPPFCDGRHARRTFRPTR